MTGTGVPSGSNPPSNALVQPSKSRQLMMQILNMSRMRSTISVSHFLAMKRCNKKLSADRLLRIAQTRKQQGSIDDLKSLDDSDNHVAPGVYCAVRFEKSLEFGCVTRMGLVKGKSGKQILETIKPLSLEADKRPGGYLVWMRWLDLVPEVDRGGSTAGDEPPVSSPLFRFGQHYSDPGMLSLI